MRADEAPGFAFFITPMQIWYCLSKETQGKLRALMPQDWQPPGRNDRLIIVNSQMESPEEIDRLMRMKPRYPEGMPR